MTGGPVSPRAILHVDMDAFFASVEVLDNPSLQGKAVIVGAPPEKHGVVAAASYEARKFGVHSAMPMARAVKLCPHGVFIHPHHHRYGEMSGKVMDILRSYTPLMEQVSVDEAYLDVTGCDALFGDAVTIAKTIKERVRKETGLTCSIGVAPNRYLAKIASDMQKPDGLTVITGDKKAEAIAPLPVDKMPGVGPVTAKRLNSIGIKTIGDLARYPPGRLKEAYGDGAEGLQGLARGEDDSPIETGGDAKSISREETFEVFLKDQASIKASLQEMADDVAEQLREEGFMARTVTLKVRDEKFQTLTRSLTMREMVATGDGIYAAALKLLSEKVELRGRAVRLLGVGASGLEKGRKDQMQLFPDKSADKKRRVAETLDQIRKKHGQEAVLRGTVMRGRKGEKGRD